MRFLLAGMTLTLSVMVARGADDGRPRTPGTPMAEAETQAYAMQLLRMVSIVTDQYAKPVERDQLVQAALDGLFEGARAPVPPFVRADIKAEMSDADLIALFTQARRHLGNIEPLRGTNALAHSIRGMTKVLDAYSGLTDPKEWNRGNADDSEPGIGLELEPYIGLGPPVIKQVVPGGPAQRAGLRPGDRITHIGNKSIVQLDGTLGAIPGVAAKLLHLPPGIEYDRLKMLNVFEDPIAEPKLEMTVQRRGLKQPITVKLAAAAFTGETVLGVIRTDDDRWDYWLDRENKIAHVRIASLASGTAENLNGVLHDLQEGGMRGLIVDLRWCPGGFLTEAVNVALALVGQRKVATVRYRDGRELSYAGSHDVPGRSARRGQSFDKVPLLVLVNGATSGGAELIAAAVQDHHRGWIAGERTLGKGSVQERIFLTEELSLKLTTGTFLRPSGKNLNRFADSKRGDDWGVRPNARQEFRISPELDRQLQVWWQWQTLRPGKDREYLPLDDPTYDPQRHSALRALLSKLGEKKAQASAD